MPRFKRLCPFSKYKEITYEHMGPTHTLTPVKERESFNACIGDKCMLYHYDFKSDTEFCMLGWNPYIQTEV